MTEFPGEIQPARPQPAPSALRADSPGQQPAIQQRYLGRRASDSGSDGLFAAAALVPALLASSCCIPQLLMTMTMGFGCLGFAVLTPFRPLFLALTAIAAVAAVQSRGWRKRTFILLLLTVFVAFSDVIIREYNDGDMQKALTHTKVFGHPLPAWVPAALAPPRWVPRAQLLLKPPSRPYPYSPSTATREQLAASDPKSAPPRKARITLMSPTIGCDACAARVKSGLVAKFGKHITSVEVRQKSKTVILHLTNQAAVNDQALLAAMAELQSPASSVSRDIL